MNQIPSPQHPTLTQLLVTRRNEGATPEQITRELVESGWDADAAAQWSMRSLRTTDRHRLLYWTLTFTTGFAALAAGSALHLALRGNPAPRAIAAWITLFLVAAPLAGLTNAWARRVERHDPHAIWSPSRRTLFAWLAGCTGTIGLLRLLTYVFRTVAAIVGVPGYSLSTAALAQVLVSLAITVPLFAWSLRQWRSSNVVVRGLTGPADGQGDPSAPGAGTVQRWT